MTGVRPRRTFDWPSAWLLFSALLVLAGCPITSVLGRRDVTPLPEYAPALYWIVVLTSLIASTVVFLRHSYLRGETELRRRQGTCLRCGYDLRATPDKCPECGMAAPARPDP